jgi:hypothetical protein
VQTPLREIVCNYAISSSYLSLSKTRDKMNTLFVEILFLELPSVLHSAGNAMSRHGQHAKLTDAKSSTRKELVWIKILPCLDNTKPAWRKKSVQLRTTSRARSQCSTIAFTSSSDLLSRSRRLRRRTSSERLKGRKLYAINLWCTSIYRELMETKVRNRAGFSTEYLENIALYYSKAIP